MVIPNGCSNNVKKSYLSDTKNLVETVELSHPAFLLDAITDRYKAAKSDFLKEAENEMTYKEFTWSVQKYLASLNDGHTSVQGLNRSMFIDVNWKAIGDSLFLLDEDGKITDNLIVSIGDIGVLDIFSMVDNYYAFENETAKERNRTLWSRSKDLLFISGCTISQNKISIKISNENGLSETNYNIKNINIYNFYNHLFSVSSKMMDNVFYIDYNICEPGIQLSRVINQLKQAISDGITSVIIDARDNPGGNSEASKALLEAMEMTEPQYGIYLRYSPLLSKQWQREENSGFIEYPRDISVSRKNPNINLVILTNENTYSAAMLLGVNVQDGSLGTIIGQSSSNAPNNYGDILNYTLPDSKIKVSISCKRFLRPNENADPNSLIPDIITGYKEYALKVALEFFKKNVAL
jgi:hypothetical protein